MATRPGLTFVVGIGVPAAVGLWLFASAMAPMESNAQPAASRVGLVHARGAIHRADRLPIARDSLDFAYFRAEVEPILLRDRGGFGPSVSACVTCHVHSATPMPLQPFQVSASGEPYWTEAQSRQNYAAIARLVVPGAPERSRLLRQPLAQDAGGTAFHVGGKMWESRDDPEWQTIAVWVRRADTNGAIETAIAAPDFGFFRTCVQKIFLDKRPGRMECINCHGGGARGFAQELPPGQAFWDEEQSRENFGVLMRYIEPGHPELSRFLHHPLAPEAGGDPFHGGGRRWQSKEDPEWRMLEAWVRGEETECVL